MAERSTAAKKLSDKNTKQEMLDAYQALAKQLKEKRQTELNPEPKVFAPQKPTAPAGPTLPAGRVMMPA
jgi:hypothetical protein